MDKELLKEKLLYQETLDLDEEGVMDLLTDLLYRDSKMKPLSSGGEYACPMCEVTVSECYEYCWHCGQAIDWTED